LQTLVAGRLSAVVSGALFTVAIQSSTATTLTVIGFVSAGLVTFAQAVGVIVGATFGTTSTPWLVAIFGFRVSVSAGALPMLGIGAFLWLIAKGRTRSLGAILAGFGLLFIGIEYLQTGMKNISWELDAIAGSGPGARWILAGIGVLMSIVMQSSSAAAATTLVALHAGSVTFPQACALIVGQSVGTAATSALLLIGGGLAVRRAALAHIVDNVSVGLLGMLLLRPLASAADWVGGQFHDPDGVLALAAFSSIFKFVGVAVFFPWFEGFSQVIVKISGTGVDSAVARLEPTLAAAGGPLALEAAWRAISKARACVDVVRRRLAGEDVHYDPPVDALRQTEQFLESLSLETFDLGAIEPRLVRLCHAVDHLARLLVDLRQLPQVDAAWRPPRRLCRRRAGARRLARGHARPRGTVQSGDLRRTRTCLRTARRGTQSRPRSDVGRDRDAANAGCRRVIDTVIWADGALHHAWRLAASLRVASGNQPASRREDR
jgi:phosphate:Na+ symporter